ncbi:MAG: YebC/PmpR family DNA-binding transcriptional regulator [Solirubrobacterales bacterium]|nr:YebC/PmpR family DNA-binding transcriptional regulator [Solirubrobacterales bacterium]MCB8915319.1 YebC/PmpR family DNA-binding transcriptional regulator [Thermoleophilales bacterium]
MSGHSKWSSIKHKKGAADAKRGKLFTKLAKAITIAAREGGGDPDGNPSLATAIQKAKAQSMPKANIDRAIDRGTGEGADAEIVERIQFEGYGPGGAAILVEALTDNRNRTSAEVRHAFTKHGGSLGEPGSVAWMFETHGVVVVDGKANSEDDLMGAIDAGASDVLEEDGKLRVLAEPSDLTAVRQAIESDGIEIESAGLEVIPKNTVEVEESEAGTLIKLLDAIEDQEDVNEVHANFDISDEVLERIAG